MLLFPFSKLFDADTALDGFSIDNMRAGRIIKMNYCVIEGSDCIGEIQLLRACSIFVG